MENALVACILSQAGVASLIGTRLYPTEFPQNGALPAATYQMISGPRDYSQDGPTKLTPFRFQLRIRAKTPAQAIAVRDALVNSNANGEVMAGFGSPPVKINAIFYDNEVAENDPPLQPLGTKLYGMRIDAIVWANVR